MKHKKMQTNFTSHGVIFRKVAKKGACFMIQGDSTALGHETMYISVHLCVSCKGNQISVPMFCNFMIFRVQLQKIQFAATLWCKTICSLLHGYVSDKL